jgi:plastocyanin
MRTRTIGLATAILLATGIGACSKIESILGLSHVVNDDGNDKTNPAGHNPGNCTVTLTVLLTTSTMHVGDTLSALATTPCIGLVGTVWANIGMTDSSVASIVPNGNPIQYVAAHSVGQVKLTGHYESAVAPPFGIDVLPRDGISAWVDVDPSTFAWSPPAFGVAAGASVQFNIGHTHNVVFDAVPGVPANIAVGAMGSDIVRVFAGAGTFTYHCSIHGEAGAVTVTP